MERVIALAVAIIVGFLLIICGRELRKAHANPAAACVPLSESTQRWKKRGIFIDLFGNRVFVVRIPCSAPSPLPRRPTFVLVHGYPSSSFDYAEIVDQLSQHGDVLLHDHVGFGFSARPDPESFCYSVFEHADVACGVWIACGVGAQGPAVIVAHDMGDSVVAEVLTRHRRGLLPASLQAPGAIAGAMFTNGGMRIRLANLRASQRVLLTPAGPILARAATLVGRYAWGHLFKAQIRSIWGKCRDKPAHAIRDAAISHMLELACWGCDESNPAVHVSTTARYLRDRYEYEYRWDEALNSIGHAATADALRIALLWGDADAVSPLSIANAILQCSGPSCKLNVLRGVGHFLMIEAPKQWIEEVVSFGQLCLQ